MPKVQGIATLVLATVLCVAADKPEKRSLELIAESYRAKRPATPPPVGLSYETALETQKDYLEIVGNSFGKRAGYKVGLVTATGQKRYNITHPIRGVLFEKMLLKNDATLNADYGTRPILEPDLLVKVKDAGINDAGTIEEAARHLSAIICFIELADGTFDTNAPADAGVLVAGNVGARAGVLGESREIKASKEFLDAFKTMSLVLKKEGKELSRVTADGVMEHPLNAVLWLVNDLKRTGEKLSAGDVISLGSPSPQVTPQAGDKFTLVYEGLPGGPLSATVKFAESAEKK